MLIRHNYLTSGNNSFYLGSSSKYNKNEKNRKDESGRFLFSSYLILGSRRELQTGLGHIVPSLWAPAPHIPHGIHL